MLHQYICTFEEEITIPILVIIDYHNLKASAHASY